jgi:hypothetical protein
MLSCKFSAPHWYISSEMMHGIDWMKNKIWVKFDMHSFPLFSLITATVISSSLYVQGAEIGILENHPYQIYPVKIVAAEPAEVTSFNETTKQSCMTLITKGYTLNQESWPDCVFALMWRIKVKNGFVIQVNCTYFQWVYTVIRKLAYRFTRSFL